ncbi:MAG TPA: hypothetical protein VNG93_14545 [Candidatus Dormibacteraeota bacterium]|nr:hypothetical protein [Candidatus Dormibacteraeota bacterium]
MSPQLPPALALLVFAALLAGFAAAVRALTQVDRRPRPALLAGGAVAGVVATGLGVAPATLGANVFSPDLSALGVLLAASLVAGADLVEVGLGVRLGLLAWPARGALAEARVARDGGRPKEAADAYGRAVGPLAAGRRWSRELDARLEQADALVAAADLRGAALSLHDALACARSLENPELAWNALLRAAVMDSDLDRLAMARRHLAEAATLAQEQLDRPHLAAVFAELAWIAYLGGDAELAGTCLAWADLAAGRIDPRGQFVANTTLLAGYLGMATGDLAAAESALAAVPDPAGDPDLEAGLQLARCLLAYQQGWKDSARDALSRALPQLRRARWRSRVALPLIALCLEARRQGRTEDVRVTGAAAAELAVRGGTMAALALYCADPGNDPSRSNRALELGRLLTGHEDQKAS